MTESQLKLAASWKRLSLTARSRMTLVSGAARRGAHLNADVGSHNKAPSSLPNQSGKKGTAMTYLGKLSWPRFSAVLLAALLFPACTATPTKPKSAVIGDLAPTGKLRVGQVVGTTPTPSTAVRNPATGDFEGVSIDLARELATRLGVPLEIVSYPTTGRLVESINTAQWDIAFLGIDPARATEVDFSPGYTDVDLTYLVPANPRITSVEDADKPGTRIAVAEKGIDALTLSRLLKNADLVRARSVEAAFEALKAGKADALGLARFALVSTYIGKLPGARILEGRYSSFQHGIAIPKNRLAGTAYVRDFIEEAKVSGRSTREAPEVSCGDWLRNGYD